MAASIRKFFFWLHLIAGVSAALIISLMSVTGVLLMYEKQIIAWFERGPLRVAPADPAATRLSLSSLIEPESRPSAITIWRDASEPLEVSYGRERTVYVNPYTGEPAGPAPPGVRSFFRKVTDWHRWLAMGGPARTTGRAITGASNLAFLFLVLSGLYLWLPRGWTWNKVRSILWFRGGLSGKARDFNWHNVFGIWTAIPLVFIVFSGVVISYRWAGDFVYFLAGTKPPAPQGPPPGANAQRSGSPADWTIAGPLLEQASRHVKDWKSITVRPPATERAPWNFTIDSGSGAQPQYRSTLLLRADGSVARHETFAQMDRGRQARMWLRFVHTGEYYGLAGQTIAGIASAAGAFLVWTGIALAWRRLRAWQVRRKSAVTVASV